ncbi:DEK domain-containing chromatin-associated protein 4-like isoform X2 [Lycium barbarum]|uniref:DEK domain-containing chromatin-associated protein 4-like isoform X2 n=1 Tax=Lycium barbarum TaxID=112863 RepID=UPI00293E964E|nr:DEK domain-containing chromatin-associated protein 4-like isoform X2 [Lycium barbarum]
MGEGDTVTELAEVSANKNVAAEDKSEEVKGVKEKQDTKIEATEEETSEKPVKEEKQGPEGEIEKGSKESDKSESGDQKKDRKRKRQVEDKKELEPKTPLASTIDRPVRQRKSVQRLVASIEGELTKEIHIEKGRGTALKDIPNVAYKLSKRKTDDTLKLLHTILFGRRGKAAEFKCNISRFSGFVWHENEEKQKMKVKEKLDKCIKEKLLELCDILDVPVAQATSRQEDLVPQLMDFLEAPYSTTSELLAEKDQSSKTESASKNAEKKTHEPKDELEKADQEEGPEMIKTNGVHERSNDELSNQAGSEEKGGESEEESKKDKKKYKQSSNKEPAGKDKTKKTPVSKRPGSPPKKTPSKSSKGSKHNDDNDANTEVYSEKKTTEVVKGKSSTSKKPSSRDNTGKKVLNGKGHKKADKLRPSDDELRSAICEVLKEVDFNTATFSDIVKILAKRYDTDLTPRKSSVKNMIQDELTRLVDEADEDDEEENAEEDGKQPSVRGVEA